MSLVKDILPHLLFLILMVISRMASVQTLVSGMFSWFSRKDQSALES